MNCWLDDKCCKPNTCDETCLMFRALHSTIKRSGLPEILEHPIQLTATKSDLPSFIRLKDIENNIQEYVNSGNNLVIYSTGCGNGKTTWASKLLLSYICTLENGDYMSCRGLFVNVVDLLIQLRMVREYATNKEHITTFLNKAKEADLIVWDEIGVNKLTDYEMSFLYSLINDRIANKKSNIYTSNTDLITAQNNLLLRLYSRIYSLSEKIEFKSLDFRDVSYRKMLGVDK